MCDACVVVVDCESAFNKNNVYSKGSKCVYLVFKHIFSDVCSVNIKPAA